MQTVSAEYYKFARGSIILLIHRPLLMKNRWFSTAASCRQASLTNGRRWQSEGIFRQKLRVPLKAMRNQTYEAKPFVISTVKSVNLPFTLEKLPIMETGESKS